MTVSIGWHKNKWLDIDNIFISATDRGLKFGDGIFETILIKNNQPILFDEHIKSQEKIKEIKAEGVSGSNSVKVTLDGEGEMQKIELSEEIIKEDKTMIEDLIVAAHNSAKSQLKTKTTEEISKATGGFGIPGFKWPL